MNKLATYNSLAAIHHYIEQAEAGEALAHVELCRAVAGTPAAVESDIDTLDTMEAMAERARKAAAMLTARARVLENGVGSLRNELMSLLNSQGLDELEGLTRRIKTQTNGSQTPMSLQVELGEIGSVVSIGTTEHLPQDLLQFLQKVEVWTLNKSALRSALQQGETFEWASLAGRGKHLTIKPL